MSELSEDDARWKPVAEVPAHLAHSEGHCSRMRLDLFLAETRPTLEPDGAQMYLDLYHDPDPEDAFDQSRSSVKLTSSTCATYLPDRWPGGAAPGGRRK